MTDRLSGQDAMFLDLEGPNTPGHVAALMTFEGPAPDPHELEELIASRLHLVPRFRQKLAFVPLRQGRPLWVDDDHFDLRYHLRRTSVSPDGTETDLLVMCSELMEQHLDRARPLWELYFIDGLADGGFAVFAKTHHAMVDGVSGIGIAALLLDTCPEPPATPVPRRWTPRHAPEPRRVLGRAILDGTVLTAAAAMRRIGNRLLHPGRFVREVVDDVEGVAAVARSGLHAAPNSPLNVAIGPNRRLAVVRTSFDDFKAIKDRFGGTINDVVLAVVTGALRRWLIHRSEAVDGLELEAMIPVSRHTADGAGEIGNRVSTIIAPLPVGTEHLRRRYTLICDATRKAKRSHQADASDLVMHLLDVAPPLLAAQVSRFTEAQRMANLIVTNIPGPTEPLYAAGRRLIDLFPFTPLGGGMALIVAIVSYAGRMEFGLIVDRDAIPDVDVIADGLVQSIRELARLCAPAATRRTPVTSTSAVAS